MSDKKKRKINYKRGGALPTKRTVNLVSAGYKKFNTKLMVPGLVIIFILAALFSKFAVADRLAAAALARSEVSAMQTELDQTLAEIDSMGEITEKYAHYTMADFTAEELNRADRLEAFSLIRQYVLPQAAVSSYSIADNEISITLTGKSLEKLNQISQDLENDEIVDFCILTTASTEETGTDGVTGQMTVYLWGAQEGGSEE